LALRVGELYALLRLDSNEFHKGLSQAKVAMQQAATGSKILLGGLTALAVGMGAAALKGVVLAASMEQSKVAFGTLLGSAEKADKMLKDLWDFAARTPFEFEGLQNSARMLLAFGFEADRIIPMMTGIGNAVSGLGGGAFEIDRVTRALGQMSAKGKISSQEMMQLAELGIPAWDMLAKVLGVSIPEAMKMVEKGAVPAGKAITGFIDEFNVRFPDMMDKQSKTILGMWSTIKDNVAGSLRVIGGEIITTFKISEKMEAFIAALGKIASLLQEKGLKGALAEWFPPETHVMIGAIAGAILIGLVPALISLAVGLWAAIAPLLPFLVAGAALGALAMVIYKNWGKIVGFFQGIGEGIGAFCRRVQGAFNNLVSGVKVLLARWGPWLLAALAGPLGPIVLAVIRNWDTIKEGASNAVYAIVEFFRTLPSRIWGAIKDLPSQLGEWAGSMASNIWTKFKNKLGIKSPSYIEQAFYSMRDAAYAAADQIESAVERMGTAIESATSSLTKNLDTQLSIVDAKLELTRKEMGLSADSQEYMEMQATALGESLVIQADKVGLLQTAYGEMVKTQGVNSQASQDLLLKLLEEKIALIDLKAAIEAVNVAMQASTKIRIDQGKVYGDLGGGKWGQIGEVGVARGPYEGRSEEGVNALATKWGVDVSTGASMWDANQAAVAEGLVPQYGRGGIVTHPTLALVGEDGPEAIIPINKMAPSIVVNVTGNQVARPIDLLLLAEEVARRIDERNRLALAAL